MYLNFYFSNSTTSWKKLGAQIIREVQGTTYSHFAIGIQSDNEETIYESVFPETRLLDRKEWDQYEKVNYSFSFPIPENKVMDVLVFLQEQIGKNYSLAQVVWIATLSWLGIKKLFGRNIFLNGSRNLICTELGFIFCKTFLKNPYINWNSFEQDRIDLRSMFAITKELESKCEWQNGKDKK